MKLAGAAATPKGEPSGSRSLRLRADQSQDSGVGALSRRPASVASRVGRLVSSPGGFAPMLILGKRWRFLPIDVLHIFLWQNVRSCFNQRFPRSGGEVWGAADRRCHVSGYRCIVFSASVSGRRPRQTRHFVIMEPAAIETAIPTRRFSKRRALASGEGRVLRPALRPSKPGPSPQGPISPATGGRRRPSRRPPSRARTR